VAALYQLHSVLSHRKIGDRKDTKHVKETRSTYPKFLFQNECGRKLKIRAIITQIHQEYHHQNRCGDMSDGNVIDSHGD